MSFQAYLENIKAKTGKTPEDFRQLAEKKGLLNPDVKAGDIVKWLKEDFDLGHGHAMAIYAVFKEAKSPEDSLEDRIEKHFSGSKSVWRKPYDGLMAKLKKMGNDIDIAPTNTYLSILRGDKKFAVIQITKERMDIGIKLKGFGATDRLEVSGSWNNLVTHRVRIANPKEIDNELLAWLQSAYEQIIKKK